MRSGIGLSLCIAIIVSYVMLLAPAREHIEGSVLRQIHARGISLSSVMIIITQNIVRMLLVIFTAVTACLLPYFGTLLGRVGGLTDALQAFVLPPLIYLALLSHTLSSFQIILYKCIFVWGMITITYTLFTFMISLL